MDRGTHQVTPGCSSSKAVDWLLEEKPRPRRLEHGLRASASAVQSSPSNVRNQSRQGPIADTCAAVTLNRATAISDQDNLHEYCYGHERIFCARHGDQ